MNQLRLELASLLIDLEFEMRSLNLWSDQAPAPEALQSEQPFCIDTLSFDQWLQFVFLPKLHQILDAGLELPGQCNVAPIAEEYFGSRAPAVLHCLDRIDRLLTT